MIHVFVLDPASPLKLLDPSNIILFGSLCSRMHVVSFFSYVQIFIYKLTMRQKHQKLINERTTFSKLYRKW